MPVGTSRPRANRRSKIKVTQGWRQMWRSSRNNFGHVGSNSICFLVWDSISSTRLQLTCLPLWFILLHPILGTCEASRFNSNSNRTSRFDLIRKWRADSKISNRRTCHVCRCTINNTHCSTTNFNPVSIATGICIELQPCMQYGSLVRLQSNKTPIWQSTKI